MRIVAGKFRGAGIEAPKGLATRPTSDRVRQALFNVLEHGAPQVRRSTARACSICSPAPARSVSKRCRAGRASACSSRTSAEARAAIRRNVEALGLTGVTKIWRRDATKLGEAGRIEPFDLVFCDPPYGQGLGQRALAAAIDGGWAEETRSPCSKSAPVLEIDVARALQEIDRRRYGDTEIVIARAGC